MLNGNTHTHTQLPPPTYTHTHTTWCMWSLSVNGLCLHTCIQVKSTSHVASIGHLATRDSYGTWKVIHGWPTMHGCSIDTVWGIDPHSKLHISVHTLTYTPYMYMYVHAYMHVTCTCNNYTHSDLTRTGPSMHNNVGVGVINFLRTLALQS